MTTQESKKQVDSQKLAELVVESLQEKKGQDIVLLDLSDIKNAVSDYFIICSGTSDTQLSALQENVEKQIYHQVGEAAWRKEGMQQREWILLDYVNVVVHLFLKSKRSFYGLEELWADAEVQRYE